MKYSPSIEQVWKSAAVVAKNRQTLIEPEYLFYAMLSLCAGPKPSSASGDDTTEIARLAGAFEENGLQCAESAERTRTSWMSGQRDGSADSSASSLGPISRSELCKEAFNRAAGIAAAEGVNEVQLRHLAAAIVLHSDRLSTALQLDPARIALIVSSLTGSKQGFPEQAQRNVRPVFSERTEVVLRTLDVSTVLAPDIDWKDSGPKLATFIEIMWLAGSAGSVAELLQTAIEKLLLFVPRATHGAILTLDGAGELLLKAHAPRGAVSISRVSAMQAIDQRRAFIWQRQEDLSESQLESDVEHGIYAPVFADERSFGVICLNAGERGPRFTPEDLFLAASLGHQIGLVLANRSLKAEIVESASVLERLLTNFSPQVRTHLIQRARAGRLKLGGERSEVSILCADVRGFTVMAASMDTDDLLQLLNDYFAAMVDCVFRHEGTIDKFIGDALLVVFGSPERHPHHTEQAARAALALQDAVRTVSESRRARNQVVCEIGIGIHTGEVIHGFIGSADRMEFTIIGDAVNMTTRYCAAAGRSETVISAEIYEKLWRTIKVDAIDIATKHEGKLGAYRLLSVRT